MISLSEITYTYSVYANEKEALKTKARKKADSVLGKGSIIENMQISKNVGPPFDFDFKATITAHCVEQV